MSTRKPEYCELKFEFMLMGMPEWRTRELMDGFVGGLGPGFLVPLDSLFSSLPLFCNPFQRCRALTLLHPLFHHLHYENSRFSSPLCHSTHRRFRVPTFQEAHSGCPQEAEHPLPVVHHWCSIVRCEDYDIDFRVRRYTRIGHGCNGCNWNQCPPSFGHYHGYAN